ncbi:MAG: PTS IIA-like nitrogen regulatory protein PtsN [Gammaproteobacteria bacterium]|nr:PTS IIA-like nitrogen regulatory protein PtsN [Gammaproteobacteria bacterium]
MLDLKTVLTPERTLCRALGASKKRLFESAANLISENHSELTASDVFGSLLAREKLGSTALGDGIAIPHCRISQCIAAVGTLITLEEPIDFDAPDSKPVDILFVLLVPEEAQQEHLTILGGLAELLSNKEFCQGLRDASDSQELHRFAVEFRL